MTNLEKELLTNETMVMIEMVKMQNKIITLLEKVQEFRKLTPKELKVMIKAIESKKVLFETFEL